MEPERARSAADPDASAAGVRLGTPRGRWVLAIAVLGSAMVFLDGTVVNVALPRIGRELHVTTSGLQWILDGYLLALAALILLGGSLGDRYGRRRIFVAGAALFTAASLLCAIAGNVGELVGARLLQGIGGALLTPGSLALIESSFVAADRPRAIGAWSGLGGVATAVGPLLGGYLISATSWRAIFLINLPLGAAVVALARRHIPETRQPTAAGPLDVRGAALAALGLGGITYALIEAPSGLSAAVLVAAIGGAFAFGAFIRVELRAPAAMMPPMIFRSRQFSAANAVTFVVYGALGGVFFLLIAFLQVALGYSPVAAGAASLPVTALMLLLSARAGALAQRIGARAPLTAGPLVIAVGLLLMARLGRHAAYVSGVLPAVVVFGLGLTLVVAPVTATVLEAADERYAGIASGINNAVSRVAGLLAVAILPVVAGLGGRRFYEVGAMVHGFHVAMLVCAGLAFAGGVLAWLTIRGGFRRERAPAPGSESPLQILEEPTCAVAGAPLRAGTLPLAHAQGAAPRAR